MAARISTFDDWIDLLKEWQHDIGLDRELIERFMPGYTFEAKYGPLPTTEIYFGDFKGERRWEKLREIPGNEWAEMADPLEELRKIRHGEESTQ